MVALSVEHSKTLRSYEITVLHYFVARATKRVVMPHRIRVARNVMMTVLFQ